MKSGKGEGDGYRKEKKYGSGYMYFSYICNLCFSFFMLPERKIITVRERTARSVPASSGKAGPSESGNNTCSRIFCQSGDLYRRNCYFAGVLDHFVDFVSSSKGKIK